MLLNDWKQTARTSLQEAAFALAESAVDEAIWAVLEYGDEDSDWTSAGWSEGDNGNFWYREWTLSALSQEAGVVLDLDEGRIGKYRAIVQKANSSRITIVTQGIVSGGKDVQAGTEVARYIETEFRKPNPAAYGLIARDNLNFNGRPYFDSYDSREFPYVYSFLINSGSEVTVGSTSTDKIALGLGNATIRGDLATGAIDDGSDPSGGATVTGDTIWEFEMDFPEVEIPDTTGWNDTAP
ncbi:hypothetical protein DDZ13_04840 [Coraliomargarita sinensis]|uniref:Uncharacterized protein n=1 Tax=Coraliomargarita sinensis TaxID=2174842 RepID=A0A317ZFX6_9BACT|nr:hypothetical protein [Coraliomargarita sinensis]PXA04505.1 hypothetical protein DDZ13_04840 [Coraliomargarita sinensis]